MAFLLQAHRCLMRKGYLVHRTNFSRVESCRYHGLVSEISIRSTQDTLTSENLLLVLI
jgi:hypothetical protein